MRQSPAQSTLAALRGVAFLAAFFGLVVGCGHETFDLLAPTAGSAGISGLAGQSSAGTGGAEAGTGGSALAGGGAAGRGGGSGAGPCFPSFTCGGSGAGGEGGAPCPATAFSCKRCASSKDCTEGDSPFCDPMMGRCIQCRPNADDCEPFETCNPLSHRCAIACDEPKLCAFSDTPLCDKDLGACVSCTMDSHCGGYKRTCYLGMCVECDGTKASQCPMDKPFCVALRCQKKQ